MDSSVDDSHSDAVKVLLPCPGYGHSMLTKLRPCLAAYGWQGGDGNEGRCWCEIINCSLVPADGESGGGSDVTDIKAQAKEQQSHQLKTL